MDHFNDTVDCLMLHDEEDGLLYSDFETSNSSTPESEIVETTQAHITVNSTGNTSITANTASPTDAADAPTEGDKLLPGNAITVTFPQIDPDDNAEPSTSHDCPRSNCYRSPRRRSNCINRIGYANFDRYQRRRYPEEASLGRIQRRLNHYSLTSKCYTSVNALQRLFIERIKKCFAFTLNFNNGLAASLREDTCIFKLHLNSSNSELALKWLQYAKPRVFGFSYKLVKPKLLKLQVQFLRHQNIPFKILDHSFNM